MLAQKFQELEPDDLVELVKLVKANQTADMYVKEDGEGKVKTREMRPCSLMMVVYGENKRIHFHRIVSSLI